MNVRAVPLRLILNFPILTFPLKSFFTAVASHRADTAYPEVPQRRQTVAPTPRNRLTGIPLFPD
jgi:hypothetical protein